MTQRAGNYVRESGLAARGRPSASALLLLGVVSVPVVVLALALALTWRTIVQEARDTLRHDTEIALENAERVFETHGILLRETARLTDGLTDAEIGARQAEIHQRLSDLVQGLPRVWDIYVWGADGRVLASAAFFPVPEIWAGEREYFQALRDGRPEPHVSVPLNRRIDNGRFFNVTRRRVGPTPAFAGIIGVSIDPAYFAERYFGTGLATADGGRAMALVRADGVVLARSPVPEPGREHAAAAFTDGAAQGRAAFDYSTVSAVDGVERQASARRVGSLPIYVVGSVSWPSIRAAYVRAVVPLVLLGLSATGVLILLAIRVRRQTRATLAAKGAADARARELARSEATARALLMTSPDVRTIMQQDPDGGFRVVDASAAVLETFRWQPGEVVGRRLEEFYSPEDAADAAAHMRECLASGRSVAYEARRAAGDGFRYFEVRLAPVPESALQPGTPRLLIANSRDVTERRETEARMQEVQRLEVLGQLAAGLGHDFGNVLTAVSGQLELLARRLQGPDGDGTAQTYVARAREGLQRGASLVRRMMSFATKRREADEGAVDLHGLVDGLLDFLRATVGSGIRIDVAAHVGGPLPVAVDRGQAEMVLLNLALNARDALQGRPDPAIAIALASATVAAEEVPELGAGAYAVLGVADNGAGMDAATLARATDPFFTTKPEGKGTGLGLAMARGLALGAGGTLLLHSRQGEGTRVEVWLPLVQPGPEADGLRPGAERVLAPSTD